MTSAVQPRSVDPRMARVLYACFIISVEAGGLRDLGPAQQPCRGNDDTRSSWPPGGLARLSAGDGPVVSACTHLGPRSILGPQLHLGARILSPSRPPPWALARDGPPHFAMGADDAPHLGGLEPQSDGFINSAGAASGAGRPSVPHLRPRPGPHLGGHLEPPARSWLGLARQVHGDQAFEEG